MAHFAELESMVDPTGFTSDTQLIVKRVVAVGNDVSAGGGTLEDNDCHADGETWCVNFFGGGTWKQTSYNHNFRKQYAGIGYVYNPSKDRFIEKQPYASWYLNNQDDWTAPIETPSITSDGEVHYYYRWDEDTYNSDNTLGWIATRSDDVGDPQTIYDWNGSAWVAR
jgi:hypothetical protein